MTRKDIWEHTGSRGCLGPGHQHLPGDDTCADFGRLGGSWPEKEGRAELRGDIMANEITGIWRITVKVSRYAFSSALLLREQWLIGMNLNPWKMLNKPAATSKEEHGNLFEGAVFALWLKQANLSWVPLSFHFVIHEIFHFYQSPWGSSLSELQARKACLPIVPAP